MGLFDDIQGTKKTRAAVADSGAKISGMSGGGSIDAAGRSDIVPIDARTTQNRDKGSRAGKTTTKEKEKHTREKKQDAGGDILAAGGVPVDMLPASVDDVGRLLPAWVDSWMDAHEVQDMRKASPLVFRAMCQDIGKIIKQSRILKDNTRRESGGAWGHGGNCNAYDPAAVLSLHDTFIKFCGVYDKVPFASSFAAFCGVSLSYVREYGQVLTSVGLDFAKKTHDAEMDAIRQKTSVDPVGRLAILNNEYYSGGAVASDAGRVWKAYPRRRRSG